MNFVKEALGGILKRLGYRLTRLADDKPVAVEATPTDLAILEACRAFSMTSPERLWALISAVEYVVKSQIPGAFVECGVWRGGSVMAMCKKLLACNGMDRDIWLYDTFSGMSAPTDRDRVHLSQELARDLMDGDARDDAGGVWCIASLDEVKRNVRSTGYSMERVTFVEGDICQTLPSSMPEEIALLRLDTDWYESTRIELELLVPRLSPGGVCIIDDYGHWDGARMAVDEYLAQSGLRVFLHRIDDTGRIFVKR